MQRYNIHLYREMRLLYEGIEADSHESAAAIAHDKPTSDADEIEDCEGETLAALVDVQGDEDYAQSRMIDFEPERERRAARKLLAELAGISDAWSRSEGAGEVMDYLERRLYAIRDAIAEARSSGVRSDPAGIDVHALLAGRRQIASIWSIEDVQQERPDLTEDQSWEVLQATERNHDANIGINWEVLRFHAGWLYGTAPDADAPESSREPGAAHE